MNRAILKRITSITVALCVVISQISFVSGFAEIEQNTVKVQKAYMPPNPEVYPELYIKDEGTSSKMMRSSALQSEPIKGSVAPMEKIPAAGATEKVLVIPIQFQDTAFSSTHDYNYFDNMMNGAQNSLKDYYEKNSGYFWDHSKGITINATVSPIITSAYNMSYYGRDSSANSYDDANVNVFEMAREAVRLLNAQGFDFSSFDMNGDNEIDHLFIIHAGNGQENTLDSTNSLIWSHRWEINGGEVVDGKTAKTYVTVPESGTIGVFCHEFGHDIGLPDLYDTDGAVGGYTLGVGNWDVMGSGSWNKLPGDPDGSSPANLSAWSKLYLGWMTPLDIVSNTVGTSITNTNGNSTIIRLWPEGNTSKSEYFLAEYRRKAYYDAGLPGEGVLIWHVDLEKMSLVNINKNEVNNYAAKLGVELEQADGNWNLWNMLNKGDASDPFPGTSGNNNFVSVPYGIRTNSASYLYGFNYSNITPNKFTYVEIRNINVAGDTAIMDCSVLAAVPAAGPMLKAPADLSLVPLQPNFAWTVAPGASSYRLQIAEDIGFSTVIRDINLDSLSSIAYDGKQYSYTLTSALALNYGKKYYWRVAGVNALSTDVWEWSATKSINTILPEPVPVVPANIQSIQTDNSITLSWDPSLDATGYYVMADGEEVYVTTNASIHTGLGSNTRHTYRVRASNAASTSAWSGAVTVVTTGAPMISAVVAGSVEGGETGAMVTVELTNGEFRTEADAAAIYNKANVTIVPSSLPTGVTQGIISRIDNTHLSITLVGTGTKAYDTDKLMYIKVAKELITTGRYTDVQTTLLYTATSTPSSISVASNGAITEGAENGGLITVTLTNGKLVNPLSPEQIQLLGLPAGIGKVVARISDSVFTITLSGNSTADYDQNQIITIALGQNQVLPVQPSALTGTFSLTAVVEPVPAAPAVTNDDTANTVSGIDNTMEFSTDGVNWTSYNNNLPSLSGNVTLRIRKSATGHIMSGEITTLTFTYTAPSGGDTGSMDPNSGGTPNIPLVLPSPAAPVPATPAPTAVPTPTPVLTPENLLADVSANKFVEPEQAKKVAEYIGTLTEKLKAAQTTDEQKLILISKTIEKLDDIANIIGNTADAQSIKMLISETSGMLNALIGTAGSVKGEINALNALDSIDKALTSSAALINTVKGDADRKAVAVMLINTLHSTGSLLDKVVTPEKIEEGCKAIIKNVSSIIAVDKSKIVTGDLTKELKSILEKTLNKMNTIEKLAVLQGNTAKAVITAEDAQKLLVKMDTVLAIAKQFKAEITSINNKSAVETKMVIKVPAVKGANSISASIPASLLNTMLAKGLNKIELTNGLAAVAMAPDAIKTKDVSSIILEVKQADKNKDLTAAQKIKAGNNPVYDFSVFLVNTKGKQSSLSSFTKEIEVAIPYTLAPKQDEAKLTVYYINDKGILENLQGKYNPTTGSMVFKTNHFSKFIISVNKATFSDLEKYKSFEKYIDSVAANDIMKAKTENKFMPGDSITRTELADILVNTLKISGSSEKKLKSSFAYLKLKNPTNKVSRQDMATILSSALKTYKGLSVSVAEQKKYITFSDSKKLGTTARSSVALVVKYNIMSAKTGKEFRPADTLNRAEAAQIINSVLYLK